MAGGIFRALVVTPESRLIDTPARSIVLRSSDGELTVLDGHTPLITDIVPVEVRVESEEGELVRLAVHGGYMQVESGTGFSGVATDEPASPGGAVSAGLTTQVTVFAGVAECSSEIDVDRAESARERALARIDALGGAGRTAEVSAADGTDGSTPQAGELAEAQSELARADLRLAVGSRVAH